MKKFSFLLLLFLSRQGNAILIPAYYISAKGDTVQGKIQVEFSDEKDSISYYELQYNVLFANEQGKVLLLRPGAAIKEIGFTYSGILRKMYCVKRKPHFGFHKLKRQDFIFAARMIHGPIDVYCLVIKSFLWLGKETDLAFYNNKTHARVRESVWMSESQFQNLVSTCPEAMDQFRKTGIITQSQMLDLVYSYNKYCSQ
jgi:hypothetical protein